jgi:ATP-dependent Clp protease ATP-binding subunit ClpC
LERRFQKIMVDPPTPDETIQILNGLKDRYEDHHKVRYTDDAIRGAVKLSERYITDRFLPDKAIDVLDETGARVHLANIVVPKEITELEEEIKQIRKEKDVVIKNQEFERAAVLRDQEKRLNRKLDAAKRRWKETEEDVIATVQEDDIADVVAMMTGIPVQKVAQSETDKILKMEEALKKRIVGQDEVIHLLCKAIQRTRAGLKDPNRPIGSFIFLGPTGVGKTQLAKELAKYLFEKEDALIRLDMSEYMEKFSVSRLTGAPPGYVGYEEGGQLTEKVRRHPYSVVLFDEIEKAHPDVFNILLQILDDGSLTDGLGRRVDFKNTILIMTSNVGAREIKKAGGFGFSMQESEIDYSRMQSKIMEEVKRLFNPEFLNRVDEMIVFHNLTKEHMEQIIDIVVKEMLNKVSDRQIEIELTKEAKEVITEKGFDPVYGARPLKRVIQKYIEDPIAEEMLKGKFSDGSQIRVIPEGKTLEFVEVGRKPIIKSEAKRPVNSSPDKQAQQPESVEN